jgi:hypothetical protein
MNTVYLFTKQDVETYYNLQMTGLSLNHVRSVKSIIRWFDDKTNGRIDKNILIAISNELSSSKYSYVYIKKFYTHINNFIKHLGRAHNDPSLLNMTMYMRMPKSRRTIKLMTSRIMDSEDITNAIHVI